MPKKIVGCSKQTDAHTYKATLMSSLTQDVVDAECFLVGNKRNHGKNNS